MNREAEAHLANAKVALAKGDKSYRTAAVEIAAARDAGATWADVREELGRSDDWCQHIVAWHQSGAADRGELPYATDSTSRATRSAKQVLRDAPIEEVERIVADLPRERREKIERAIVETHPALQKKTPLGVGDSIKRFESNTSFVMLMGGSLGHLSSAVRHVQTDWERFEGNASDEEKEIVQEQIRDGIASLLAINSDPQELLR